MIKKRSPTADTAAAMDETDEYMQKEENTERNCYFFSKRSNWLYKFLKI